MQGDGVVVLVEAGNFHTSPKFEGWALQPTLDDHDAAALPGQQDGQGLADRPEADHSHIGRRTAW